MLGIGLPELIILAIVAFPLGGVVLFWIIFGRRAKRFAYASTGAYLRTQEAFVRWRCATSRMRSA